MAVYNAQIKSATLMGSVVSGAGYNEALKGVESDIVTLNTALTTHTGNTSNPHGVTCAQIGAATATEVQTIRDGSLVSKGNLSAGTDFDTIKGNGVYYAGSGTFPNKPHATAVGFLYVSTYGTNTAQIFVASGYIWTRRAANSGTTWTNWVRGAVDSQITTLTTRAETIEQNATALSGRVSTNEQGITMLNTNLTNSNAYDRARMAKNLIDPYLTSTTVNGTSYNCRWTLGNDGYTISVATTEATSTSSSRTIVNNAPIGTFGISEGDTLYGEVYSTLGGTSASTDRGVTMQVRFYNADGTSLKTYNISDGVQKMLVPANTTKIYAIVYDRGHEAGDAIDDTIYGIGFYKDASSPMMSMDTRKRVEEMDNADPLYGKLWVHCGDSFSAEALKSSVFTSGRFAGKPKTYPYIIADRTGMKLRDDFFKSGRTLAFPAKPLTFTNSLTRSANSYCYTKIPSDADYITIQLGINDEHHKGEEYAADNEDNTGVIPLGTITDNTVNSYYGAWNVVLTWIRTNRPFAHVGIIVTNGLSDPDYRTAQINVAKKYGIPYIDLNGDERTPAMIRSINPDIPDSIKEIIKAKQAIDPDGSATGTVNTHPNTQAHEYQSRFIEQFLRSL